MKFNVVPMDCVLVSIYSDIPHGFYWSIHMDRKTTKYGGSWYIDKINDTELQQNFTSFFLVRLERTCNIIESAGAMSPKHSAAKRDTYTAAKNW